MTGPVESTSESVGEEAAMDAAVGTQVRDEAVPSVDELITERAGRQPGFITDLSDDKLVNCIMRLAMEVSVIRDRLDVYESIASEAIPDLQDRLQRFESNATLEQERAERRSTLIRKLIRDLQ